MYPTQPNKIRSRFEIDDTMVENIVDTVLDDIDNMILTQNTIHSSQSSLNHSPTYASASSPHSSYMLPMCNIDKLLMSDLQTLTPQSSNNSPISPFDTNISIDNAYISKFKPANAALLQLKGHIFISKDVTYRLGQYIVKENWGKQCSLLYKYLDYIFRCQCFNQQIIEIYHKSNKKVQYLLWHTGLQRRSDNQFLYILLVSNAISKKQKWRVQFGNIRNSFLSKSELLQKLNESQIVINAQYLPQRTKFTNNLSDLLYDDSHTIQANWEERLTTNSDRIFKVMGSAAFFDDSNKYLKLSSLIGAFVSALPKTQRIAELNPRLAVAQGFVDTKHCKYRMELLLPIIIRFPKYNGNNYKFVLAIGKSAEYERVYNVKSILTMDMAYANARLVGYVDSLWLHSSNHRRNNNKDINEFVLNV